MGSVVDYICSSSSFDQHYHTPSPTTKDYNHTSTTTPNDHNRPSSTTATIYSLVLGCLVDHNSSPSSSTTSQHYHD